MTDQCHNCFAALPEPSKCLFCDVATEHSEVLRASGITSPALWIAAQLEQVALDQLMGRRGTDFDRVHDHHGHLLSIECKWPEWPRSREWSTVQVAQYLPLQSMSRSHLTLVVVHVRSFAKLVTEPQNDDLLWVAEVAGLVRGANTRGRFLACSPAQFVAGIDAWFNHAQACDETHGCWNNGCPLPVPQAFEWWRAIGDDTPPTV